MLTHKKIRWISLVIIQGIFLIGIAANLFGQVGENERRYIRIGELQSHFSAYGSERAWNNTYYEGLRWPADYPLTDNAVIKRSWIAVEDFTDADGEYWEHWGTYISKGYVLNSLYPMELKQTAKFERPTVYVDGENITAPYTGDVDAINPNQVADRVVTNVVNTSIGLTFTRRVLAFSQQYHDNYFIKEIVLTNTGNIDYDPEIELDETLQGVRVGWGTRYSVSREGASNSDNQQSWGKFSWVTRRGEQYAQHAAEVNNFTENTPFTQLEWIRGAFSWMGQSGAVNYDMIGAPAMNEGGRLSAPQFAGSAVLHVDQGPDNPVDDPQQPTMLGWHAGDTYPSVGNLQQSDKENMNTLYNFLSGNPYPTTDKGGDSRMFKEFTSSITDRTSPHTIHGDGGGTNVWITYGPFDIDPGDSVKIVEVEGINGLDRQTCIQIGKRWYQAYSNPGDNGPFTLPDGSTTTDEDVFKNSWVYTGMDSIMLTFSRALRNYNMDYQIPQPPLPPPVFEVESGGDRIMLSWVPSPSELNDDFAGYRVYRAIGRPDTTYEMLAELPPGAQSYEDKNAVRGFSYYYYLTAINDGSNNTSGVANPTGVLESGRFYTKTNKPAYLRRMAGESLDDIRIVPNPFNVRAEKRQYTGEPDKIMFLNVPAYCRIKIFTERGDLIKTINHQDGSGDHEWNSITSSRQVVVSGVYIAHFEVTQDYPHPETGEILYRKGETAIRKFLVIR